LNRIVDALLPRRLGRDFRFLWLASTSANLADGVLLAAGPLLVASITREPFAVAMAVFVQRLPWLLFGVLAGAVIDRVDRRVLMVTVDGIRAAVIGLLAVAIAFDAVNLPTIYVAMFLIGTAETVADNASSVLVAVTVPREGLGQANSRLHGMRMVTNQLAGPPLGALLFGVGVAVPFAFNTVCLLLAAVLISRMRLRPAQDEARAPGRLRSEVAEGLRWLWSHAPVRTLAILITVFNITFGAAFSIWVLYAFERLGLSELGFGVLMSASAVGGLVGAAAFGWLEQRFSYAWLLRVGLVVETLTHFALALTTTAAVAGAVMALFGVHAVVWGTTSTTVRQRAVPDALLGRVTSVYMLGSLGALALGALLGGVLAQRWGVLAPFWFAGTGAALTTAVVWRSITHIAEAAEPPGQADPIRPVEAR
jgi:MFS family permease